MDTLPLPLREAVADHVDPVLAHLADRPLDEAPTVEDVAALVRACRGGHDGTGPIAAGDLQRLETPLRAVFGLALDLRLAGPQVDHLAELLADRALAAAATAAERTAARRATRVEAAEEGQGRAHHARVAPAACSGRRSLDRRHPRVRPRPRRGPCRASLPRAAAEAARRHQPIGSVIT